MIKSTFDSALLMPDLIIDYKIFLQAFRQTANLFHKRIDLFSNEGGGGKNHGSPQPTQEPRNSLCRMKSIYSKD